MPLSPGSQQQQEQQSSGTQRPARRPREGSRSVTLPWFNVSYLRRSQDQEREDDDSPTTLRESDREGSQSGTPQATPRNRLHIDMPPTSGPFTLAHNRTPGWDTPWTSSHPGGMEDTHEPYTNESGSHHDDEKLTPWQRRRKRLRAYMMYNLYVPLVRSTFSDHRALGLISAGSSSVYATSFSPLQHSQLQSAYGSSRLAVV